MKDQELLERLPKEPTVKQIRIALKFGKDFNQLEKMSAETADQMQELEYAEQLIDEAVAFIKEILNLKPKETKVLEEWTMSRLISLAFKAFYKLINPTGETTSVEDNEKK